MTYNAVQHQDEGVSPAIVLKAHPVAAPVDLKIFLGLMIQENREVGMLGSVGTKTSNGSPWQRRRLKNAALCKRLESVVRTGEGTHEAYIVRAAVTHPVHHRKPVVVDLLDSHPCC